MTKVLAATWVEPLQKRSLGAVYGYAVYRRSATGMAVRLRGFRGLYALQRANTYRDRLNTGQIVGLHGVFEEGEQAKIEGKWLTANPHPRGSSLSKAWLAGWDAERVRALQARRPDRQ